MSFAISAQAPRLNADVFFGPRVDPPPTDPGHPPIPDPKTVDVHSMLGAILERVGLNPQPLPPKADGATPTSASRSFDGDWCGTVPRGLPLHGAALERVGLNPQPLPPKADGAMPTPASRFSDGDWCGTVPRRLPHFPPPPPPWLGGSVGEVLAQSNVR